VTTRIELNGRLSRNPDLRVTPAGTQALLLEVDCGDSPGRLILKLVMTGAALEELAHQLHKGMQIRAAGELHVLPTRARSAGSLGVEVVASMIQPAP